MQEVALSSEQSLEVDTTIVVATIHEHLAIGVERMTAAKRRVAMRAATSVMGLLAHAVNCQEEPRHSVQDMVQDLVGWEVERSVLMGSAGLAVSANDLASSLSEPPDWQRNEITPLDKTLLWREPPLHLPSVTTPPWPIQSTILSMGGTMGCSRPGSRGSPLPPIDSGLGSTTKLPPVNGLRTNFQTVVDEVFTSPIKDLEHKSGRVPNISPVRPAAGLLSGMPRVRNSKISCYSGFYRSWESKISVCEDGPTKFDRNLIYEHMFKGVKRVPPTHPFPEAPPYVSPWEDPMEAVDMSIKPLDLIITQKDPLDINPDEVEVTADNGTFKVKSLSEMKEEMKDKLPGWAFPKKSPPVLGAYAHGASIDARGF